MAPGLRVLFLAAEADPFIKIGGLGDVAGSLPAALRAISPSIDIRLALPYHGPIQRMNYQLQSAAILDVPKSTGSIRAEASSMMVDELPVYMINGEPIDPDGPVYSPDASLDGYKFTFFSLAALEMARAIDWIPHVVHANDWHTSPAVYWLWVHREQDTFYRSTAMILGVHNLPYLGAGADSALEAFNLPPAVGSRLPKWAQHMPLPLGLLAADRIVTVSPTYSREILTPEFGSGLHQFLRTRSDRISGILNGIDMERWNPETDSALVANFNQEGLTARAANKAALQKEFDLQADDRIPLLAIISRLDPQKGIDLVPDALRQIRRIAWQAIILGTGSPELEEAVRRLEGEFPDRVRAAIRFDGILSRRMYAGADALMIPSRYEPCGLTQMIAMRYGCVPVARATGGLRDTILDYQESPESTGFLFKKASSPALAGALRRALKVYNGRDAWSSLQKRGMSQDFSWERSAREYLKLYQSIVKIGAED